MWGGAQWHVIMCTLKGGANTVRQWLRHNSPGTGPAYVNEKCACVTEVNELLHLTFRLRSEKKKIIFVFGFETGV